MGGSDPLDRSSRARMRWLGSNRFGSAHDSGGSLAARFTSRGTAAVTGALPPRRRLAGAGSPRLGVALRRTRTSARERGDPGFAHLGSGVPAKWSRTSRDDDGRRRTGSFGGNGRGGFAPGSWLHGAARREPAKLGRRSARPGGAKVAGNFSVASVPAATARIEIR
jgi:hypothetical protein